MKLFLSLFFILLTNTLFAQTLKDIKFDGIYHISKPVAIRLLPFEKGDDIDIKMVDDAIKIYFKQGYFNDIYAEFDDGILKFYFKEKAIISKVELKGWKESDEDIFDTVVQLKKGTLYDEKKIESAKKRIIEAISQDGKIDTVVEVETTYLDNGSVKVTFLVNEGEEIIINKLTYSGVYGLDSDDFDDVIANKEHQFMGWFWGRNDGVMHLRDLEYDNFRIKDFYMQHGYLDAKVDKPFVQVNFDSYTAKMSYEIKEGEQYKINKITIYQDKKVIDNEILFEALSLKDGDIFNIKKFREDSDKIKTLVADLSYAFVQVIPDLKKDKDKKVVDVIFRVIAGDKVKIRNVLISGNNRTLDRIIRRELYLGPNDMYSLTDLRDSRKALGRLGFFEGNTIEEKRVDSQTMDLVVKVKESPTGNIQLGGGYGTYGGVLLNVSVSDRNIWGSGINVGVKAERSERTKSYSFNISNPRLNDSDFSGNFSIYHSSSEYDDYSVNTNGVSAGVGHRFSRHITGYLGYGYSENSYDFGDNFDSYLYINKVYYEGYSKSGVTISVKWDNTDDYYLPREGFVLSQSFEKTGLGADASYIKSKTTFSKYYSLDEILDFDVIFRYKARLYNIIDNGYVPLVEKFYIGGIGSVRGYESYSLSPSIVDYESHDNLRVGGTQTFSNSLELSFPLIKKAKMRLVTYLDWGFVADNISKNLVTNNISRAGYGTGVEWFSPVGPIQFMFSRPINPEADDKISRFEFTIGQRF